MEQCWRALVVVGRHHAQVYGKIGTFLRFYCLFDRCPAQGDGWDPGYLRLRERRLGREAIFDPPSLWYGIKDCFAIVGCTIARSDGRAIAVTQPLRLREWRFG